MFESRISLHSARGRLKKEFGDIITSQIYDETINTAQEHLHLLPSFLSLCFVEQLHNHAL